MRTKEEENRESEEKGEKAEVRKEEKRESEKGGKKKVRN